MKTALIITTINKPNKNILKFSNFCKQRNWELIVIGDKRSPKKYQIKYGKYLNLEDQKKLNFNYSKICPINSYSRKNIGYLIALHNNNDFLIETDDDNFPKNNFFISRKISHLVNEIKNKNWVNVYDLFLEKDENIWPRGLPLKYIKLNKIKITTNKKKKNFYLQQGLADNNPDVDAIYRIMNNNINIKFKTHKKISIGKSFTPINSQNTSWFKAICPLMYLPSTCSMRATDIIRGYVALNILNKHKLNILFHGSNLIQYRNIHDLSKDFYEELILYKNSNRIYKNLQSLNFENYKFDFSKCLLISYNKLIKINIIKKTEIKLLKAWIKDLKNFNFN